MAMASIAICRSQGPAGSWTRFKALEVALPRSQEWVENGRIYAGRMTSYLGLMHILVYIYIYGYGSKCQTLGNTWTTRIPNSKPVRIYWELSRASPLRRPCKIKSTAQRLPSIFAVLTKLSATIQWNHGTLRSHLCIFLYINFAYCWTSTTLPMQ
jgi:hypothetical protein